MVVDRVFWSSEELTHWQAENRRAVERRLAPLRSKQDGVILVEPAGPHFVVVIKRGSSVRMLLMEQSKPRTEMTQAHLDLDRPFHLVAPYTQAMTLGLLWPRTVHRIYAIGLGGGRLPMVLHHLLPAAEIDCTEIEPMVQRAAGRCFGLRTDERLRVAIEDGRNWLASQKDGRLFDLILVDAFLDNGYTPYWLATKEFYELARSRMSQDGVVIVNLLATDPFLADKIETARAVFPLLALCPAGQENRVLYGSLAGLPERDDLSHRAAMLKSACGISYPFEEWVDDLEMSVPHQSAARILHDDAPPVDYFAALPSFDGAFARTGPDLPCPCGSGSRFAACHGVTGGQEV